MKANEASIQNLSKAILSKFPNTKIPINVPIAIGRMNFKLPFISLKKFNTELTIFSYKPKQHKKTPTAYSREYCSTTY